MANNNDNKSNKFLDGVKRGAGMAVGGALVVGAFGFLVGGPAGAALGFKAGLGAGTLGGGA